MKVEVTVLGSPSLIVLIISRRKATLKNRGHELCESRGGRPGLPVPNSQYGLFGRKATLNCSITEVRSCVKVEVAALGSPSLTVSMVSVDVKQH